MPLKHIVIGQNVVPQKAARARQLRQQMTAAETLLWHYLRTNRLSGWHFRRQQVIAGFIVDFYCHAAALVVEADGPIHENRAEYDVERDRALTDLGLRVLRFKNAEVLENPGAVMKASFQACEEQAGANDHGAFRPDRT